MREFSTTVVSVGVLLALAGSAVAQQGGTPIAMSGLPVNHALGTGTANGTAGAAFSSNAISLVNTQTSRTAVISQNGTVVFNAAFAGGAGVWRNSGGGNVNLGRAGTLMPVPNAAGANYTIGANNHFNAPLVDAGGNPLFHHAIGTSGSGPSLQVVDAGFFRADAGGAMNFAARGTTSGTFTTSGSPIPGDFTATPVMHALGAASSASALMNNNGALLLIGGASLNSNILTSGMWTGTANAGAGYDTLTPVVLRAQNTYAMNTGAGTVSGMQPEFVNSTVSFNDNARAAYVVDFTSASIPSSSQNRGLVTNRNGAEQMLVMRNTGAFWLPAGVTATSAGSAPSMNNAGQIATTVPLAGAAAGITQANDSVIARFENGPGQGVFTLTEGAASGRTTGGGAGILLGGQLSSGSGFGSSIISGSGTILSSSTGNTDTTGAVLAAGAGNAALFTISGATNAVNVIALTGDAAPGTTGVFNSFDANRRAINNNDLVAFTATLVQNVGGVTSGNDSVLYATDPSGNLVLIAREGFALPGDVVPGRTVSTILFGGTAAGLPTNGHDGRGVFFNDMNQLVFNIGFSDGNSAVFVTSVPVPGAACGLGLGLAAAVRRRRR